MRAAHYGELMWNYQLLNSLKLHIQTYPNVFANIPQSPE